MSYEDANVKVPPKVEHQQLVVLTGKQKDVYDFILGLTRKVYDQMLIKVTSFAGVLAMFTRLRQCAIAPYLLTADSKRDKPTPAQQKADENMMKMIKEMDKDGLGLWCYDKKTEAGIYSAKMNAIIDTLSKIPKGEKVLIFSMFTSCLDLLRDALEERLPNFRHEQIDGATKGKDRERILEAFRTKPFIRGLLITYKCGSEGLNLTEANHVICIEPWWTNAVHNQAKSRCWRTGQTKEVQVHNIFVEESIEVKINEICKEKDELASSYLDGTQKPLGKSVGLDKFTLGRILGKYK
jgi:SNF2 family DNA or RNA helicase